MVAVQHELKGRARIVMAARHLFAVRGFHQTAMSELATEADVSVGQIYRLFKGKEDIILAIVEEDIANRVAQMTLLADAVESGAMSLEEGLYSLATLAMTSKDEALGLEIMAEGHRNTVVADKIACLCVGFRSAIRDIVRIAQPGLSEPGLDAREELLLACMFGLAHRSLSAPPMSNEETAARTTKLLIAALTSAD